jgi:exonuclease III
MPALNIVSWNILHGGGSRCESILEKIHSSGADIVTLQEFRHGKHGDVLLEGLKSQGLTSVCAPPTSSARENTLLIASRLPMQAEPFPAAAALPARAIKAVIEVSPTVDLQVVAVHFPQKRAQVPYFNALQELSDKWLNGYSLLIGDFNCGIPFEDSQTKTFYATHLFQQLLHSGWCDAWRSRYPDDREFTWVSTRKGNGFRYDHALVSASLNGLVTGVEYDHEMRLQKISDHSSLHLELDC